MGTGLWGPFVPTRDDGGSGKLRRRRRASGCGTAGSEEDLEGDPPALPREARSKAQVGRVARCWEAGSAQGTEEGAGRLCPADPPWPAAHRAFCALLAPCSPLHMAVAGGWWLRLGARRLLPLPGEGAESRAEWVIIDSPPPGRSKPVPSIPGVARGVARGSEPSRPMGRAKQRQLGGGRWGRDSQLSPVLPLGSSGEACPTSFSGCPAGGTGEGLGSCGREFARLP